MNRSESLVLLQMDLRGGDIWLCPQRHAVLVRETCGSGYRDAADCGRRYLDIKNKRRWGYAKTGAPVSCELRSVIARKLRMAGCEAGSTSGTA